MRKLLILLSIENCNSTDALPDSNKRKIDPANENYQPASKKLAIAPCLQETRVDLFEDKRSQDPIVQAIDIIFTKIGKTTNKIEETTNASKKILMQFFVQLIAFSGYFHKINFIVRNKISDDIEKNMQIDIKNIQPIQRKDIKKLVKYMCLLKDSDYENCNFCPETKNIYLHLCIIQCFVFRGATSLMKMQFVDFNFLHLSSYHKGMYNGRHFVCSVIISIIKPEENTKLKAYQIKYKNKSFTKLENIKKGYTVKNQIKDQVAKVFVIVQQVQQV